MEDRLISVKALKGRYAHIPKHVQISVSQLDELIDSTSSAHGHWVKHGEGEYNCSKCGAHWEADEATVKSFRYCSWCGARMNGREG